jgi:hypothetical protein
MPLQEVILDSGPDGIGGLRFNNDRLHESLGDVSPAEFESLYVAQGVQLSNIS